MNPFGAALELACEEEAFRCGLRVLGLSDAEVATQVDRARHLARTSALSSVDALRRVRREATIALYAGKAQ